MGDCGRHAEQTERRDRRREVIGCPALIRIGLVTSSRRRGDLRGRHSDRRLGGFLRCANRHCGSACDLFRVCRLRTDLEVRRTLRTDLEVRRTVAAATRRVAVFGVRRKRTNLRHDAVDRPFAQVAERVDWMRGQRRRFLQRGRRVASRCFRWQRCCDNDACRRRRIQVSWCGRGENLQRRKRRRARSRRQGRHLDNRLADRAATGTTGPRVGDLQRVTAGTSKLDRHEARLKTNSQRSVAATKLLTADIADSSERTLGGDWDNGCQHGSTRTRRAVAERGSPSRSGLQTSLHPGKRGGGEWRAVSILRGAGDRR
jgi:hypothetical protein